MTHANRSIYLVRHGQSEANAGQPTGDPAAIALTATGRDQAQQLALDWAIQPAQVLSSPYQRAQDTALPFCSRHAMTPEIAPGLHEFVTLAPQRVNGLSNFERKPFIDAYWAEADPTRVDGPGAESLQAFSARTDAFALQLPTLPDRTVVFGHGMWFAMLIWRLMRFPVDSRAAMKAFRSFQLGLPMPNCGVYALTGSGATWSVQFCPQASGFVSAHPATQAYTIQ